MTHRLRSAFVLLVFLGGFLTAASLPVEAQTPDNQVESMLTSGTYVPDLVPRRYTEPFVLQRLTERTYWVAVASHNSLFYVGDQGVIVFDPLSAGWGQAVLQAIASATDLPVSALVYSHFHLDHLGDTRTFVNAAASRGAPLRIIATGAVAAQIECYGTPISPPTEVIEDDPGEFSFEGLRVHVQSAQDSHSTDNSLFLLQQEQVLHYVDSCEPEDLIPYFRLGGIQEVGAAIDSLNRSLDMRWQFLSAGHGDVGSKQDIEKHLELIADIRAATLEAMAEEPFGDYVDPEIPDAVAWIAAHEEAVVTRATEKLRPKYGESLRFDLTMDSHIEMMMGDIGHFGGQ